MDVGAARELGEQLTFPRPAKCSEKGLNVMETEVEAICPEFGALGLCAGSGVVVRHCLFKAGQALRERGGRMVGAVEMQKTGV